jgi:hypothetical protein
VGLPMADWQCVGYLYPEDFDLRAWFRFVSLRPGDFTSRTSIAQYWWLIFD